MSTKELIREINLLESTARTHTPGSASYNRLMDTARERRDELRRERAAAKGQPDPTRQQRAHRPPPTTEHREEDLEDLLNDLFGKARSEGSRSRMGGNPFRGQARRGGPTEGEWGTSTQNCSACGVRFTSYSYYDKCPDCSVTGKRRMPHCSYCGERGHTKANCPNKTQEQRRDYNNTDFSYSDGPTKHQYPNGCGTHTNSKWGPKVCNCGSKVAGRLNKSTGIRRVFCKYSGHEIFVSEPRFFD